MTDWCADMFYSVEQERFMNEWDCKELICDVHWEDVDESDIVSDLYSTADLWCEVRRNGTDGVEDEIADYVMQEANDEWDGVIGDLGDDDKDFEVYGYTFRRCAMVDYSF